MKPYIEAMRAATAEKCDLRELAAELNHYADLAVKDYKAGSIDIFEFEDIVTVYSDIMGYIPETYRQ